MTNQDEAPDLTPTLEIGERIRSQSASIKSINPSLTA